MSSKDISKIDKNFSPAVVNGRETAYYDTENAPFVFEGLAWNSPPDHFRLPRNFTTGDVNAGALELSKHTAGCCIRFKSDTRFISVRAKLTNSFDMNHMPRCGSAGFDLYIKKDGKFVFVKAAQPNRDEIDFERLVYPEAPSGMNEYLLNYPLYGGVEKVEIGMTPGCTLEAPTPHKISKPILFYGSSITQGGCASRPGNAYTSMLCRKLDAPQINLGFAGSGKGEIAVAKAIAELDLSCFVMDYDHNAPDAEHLKATHEIFFKTIREKNPELPILILSMCDFYDTDHHRERRAVIQKTYENALAAGDKHVAFIDGELLWGTEDRDACSVDGCHPNDLGFYRMAETICPVLEELLER